MDHPFVIDLNFRDHVARDVPRSVTTLAPVKTVGVFLTNYLEKTVQCMSRNGWIRGKIRFYWLFELTLISWPSLNGNSSSHASGFGDIVGGS